MAEESPQPDPDAGAPPSAGQAFVSWAQVWHLPVLLLGLGLFALGVYVAVPGEEPPNYSRTLDSAGQYLKANNLSGAEKELKKVQSAVEKLPNALKGRYWQYWADLNYLQLRRRQPEPVDTPKSRQTRQKIVRYYNRAAKRGHSLRPVSLQRKAKTLVALDEQEKALQIVNERLAEAPADRRYPIIRAMIERQRRGESTGQSLAKLIEAFKTHLSGESDDEARLKQRLWIAGVQAERHIEADSPEKALDYLLRRIPRLKAKASNRQLAPLHVKLARAYQKLGELGDAERYYQLAQQHIDPSSPLNAKILVGLARTALERGDTPKARREAQSLFSQVVENYPSKKPAYIKALIGAGDVEARLGNHSRALGLFDRGVKRLVKQTGPDDSLRQQAIDRIRSHIKTAKDQQDYGLALDLLRTFKSLHRREGELPAELLLDFATTHERIAEQRKAFASGETQGETAAPPDASDATTAKARRLANQDAAIHFGKAGEFYRRHAKQVTVTNNARHGKSLWTAARSFDKAQRWDDAIKTYTHYIETRPDDPRRLEAINHLGRALLADGQYQPAVDRFQTLLKEHPKSPQAHASLVPIARAYMGLDKRQRAAEALRRVVNDHPAIRPGSDTYRQALVELGKLYYRMGDQDGEKYVQAIETLNEAVTRYGDGPKGPSLRFLLADSYRRSVDVLSEKLKGELSQRKRLALQQEREDRLKQAQIFYDKVINQLEARPAESLSALEELYHRNAYFYQADCAFDRKQYELAIDLYKDAEQKWEDEPASLVALVQIVNAHCELGNYQEAGVYNSLALERLKQMPDEAFNQPGLPMSREHWEDWLRWTSERDLFSGPQQGPDAQQAAAG
jgi:tetratricopeptide (TPR) repeat protein